MVNAFADAQAYVLMQHRYLYEATFKHLSDSTWVIAALLSVDL